MIQNYLDELTWKRELGHPGSILNWVNVCVCVCVPLALQGCQRLMAELCRVANPWQVEVSSVGMQGGHGSPRWQLVVGRAQGR